MFRFAGYEFNLKELETDSMWFSKYFWTEEKQSEFREFAISETRKQLRWNKKKSTDEINYWLLNYGLSTNQPPQHATKPKS
jgi:uncharacterized protein YhjY with autotransporter beta-barrel domain